MLKQLFGTYPQHDVVLDNFINALSPSNPHFATTLASVLITFLLGFLVYVYAFILVEREHSGPYPLWMHTFYLAADFMGAWVFLNAYFNYRHFWFFLLGGIGEFVWVGFELYSLWRAGTYERDEIWGPNTSTKQVLRSSSSSFRSTSCGSNLTTCRCSSSGFSPRWLSAACRGSSGKSGGRESGPAGS